AGGLYVLGTTRHESRRIDNQLRGRAGRQGDPGTTRFFISLQDDVFRVFGGDKIESLMDRFRLGDQIPLQSPIVNDTLDRVQKAVEEFFKKTRTTLFEFDKVISKQRELTYNTRKEFLANDDEAVLKLVKEWGKDAVKFHIEQVTGKTPEEEKSTEEKATEFKEYFGLEMPELSAGMKPAEVEAKLNEVVQKGITEKAASYEEFRPGFAVEAARIATVVTIDDEWKALLQKMDALKQTVGLAAYKGSEPLKEYQVQGFRMYQK
ncbi:secA, partial [Symbiodinium sp. CCMP2456]